MSVSKERAPSLFHPVFTPALDTAEPPSIQETIDRLRLQRHPEGGYYVETDRDPRRVLNPFLPQTASEALPSASGDEDDCTRSASTTIYYLLSPTNPTGVFHRNKGRTIHTLHKGRGRYVVIHADQMKNGQKARVETFVVGHDLQAGERMQWLVEGGKYKASFLLPDVPGGERCEGLLISETVVPGFEFRDHNSMPGDVLSDLVSREQSEQLRWLLSARS
ncbi:hypothetical protein MMC13_003485 [Lambiella insularis]|nr:hypothetical protein [Lambiella insularis]